MSEGNFLILMRVLFADGLVFVKRNVKIKREDNKMKHGYFYRFQDAEISDLSNLGNYGFEFDWSIKMADDSNIIGYIYEGIVTAMVQYSSVTHSLFNEIHLLETSSHYRNMGLAGKMMAYVAQDSFDKGFEGFMLTVAKSALMDFYTNHLGGKQIGHTNRIRFDTQASLKIIERYGEEK